MNREQLLALPDLELRIKVAHEVMGLFNVTIDHVRGAGELEGQTFAFLFHTVNDRRELVPDYPRDPGAAWQVVEKMRERGYSHTLDSAPATDEEGHRSTFRWWSDDHWRQKWVDHPSMPRAVAVAALLALAHPGGST